jgi:hypothetical protein
MRLTRIGSAIVTVALTFRITAPALAQTPATGPALTFGQQSVQVQGMTPNGTVVWFGMGLDIVEYSEMRSEVQEPAVADAQGNSTLEFAADVPPRSVYVAVDLATGAYAVGSPTAFTPGRFAVAPSAILNGAGATPDQLADSADFIHVLLVRPGQGAWAATIGRGGAADQSEPGDPNLRFAIESLQPVTPNAAAAPAKLTSNDILFVARPRVMEMGTARVH